MKIILFFLFTISAVFSTSCVDQSTNNSMAVSIPQHDDQSTNNSMAVSIPQIIDQSINNSMAVSIPQSIDQSINNSMAVSMPQLHAMHHCNDGVSSMAQALSYPIETYDMRALFEYCFPNYHVQSAMVNGLGITVAAGFDNTDECLSSRVGSDDQSLGHVPIRQGRRLMREVDRTPPAPPEGDKGPKAPRWDECLSSCVGSDDQSLGHVPIRQYYSRRLMREVDRTPLASPEGGPKAPRWPTPGQRLANDE